MTTLSVAYATVRFPVGEPSCDCEGSKAERMFSCGVGILRLDTDESRGLCSGLKLYAPRVGVGEDMLCLKKCAHSPAEYIELRVVRA